MSCGTQEEIVEHSGAIADLLEKRNYRFEAQQSNANQGYRKTLTADYFVSVTQDTLFVWLPYIRGASNNSSISFGEDTHFITSEFDYSIDETKKGWEIRIVPYDQTKVRNLTLSVTSAGKAILRVPASGNRPAYFYGNIIRGSVKP